MSLTFRRAQPEDMGLLLSLIKELARYEHLEREVTATEEILSEWLFAKKKAEVITFTGFGADNKAKQMGDINVYVPATKYGIVESIHNIILQQVVDMIMERDGVSL